MNQPNQIKNTKIAFIKANWHSDIVDRCLEGFNAELSQHGYTEYQVGVFDVPGAFDIPLLAKRLAQSGRFDAIVASGFVVDGGIYRHDFVSGTVVDALMRVQLETEVPIISAVLTPHQFQETAAHKKFFREHFVIKGKEAAEACLKILDNFEKLKNESHPTLSLAQT